MADSLEQSVKVRICPVCNTHNFGESIMCTKCDFSLGDVDFIDLTDDGASRNSKSVQDERPLPAKNDVIKAEAEKPESGKKDLGETVVEKPPSLTFCSVESGKRFQAKNGSILGRTNIGGKEAFDDIDTVSREHAKIFWNGLDWEIEDVSRNGTCIDGTYLTKGKRYKIKIGDTIHFSSRCPLKVIA